MVKETKRKSRDLQSIIDLASSVLSVSMLSPQILLDLDLSPDHFPLEWQQDTWSAIQFLYNSKTSVDVVLVADRLVADNSTCPEGKWLGFLSTVIRDNSATLGNTKKYVELLVGWRKRTRSAEIGTNLIESSMDGVDGSDEAIRDLMALSASTKIMDGPLADSVPEAVDALDARSSAKSKIHGIPFGIGGLDRLLSGMGKTHLYILAARPAMGKTAMALNICEYNCKTPLGFISTEQPRKEMIDRLVSMRARVDSHAIRTGNVMEMDWPKLSNAYADISTWPFYMNDRAGPDITDIERQARKWKHRYDIKLLVVDYIQRVKVKGAKSRHEEVGTVAFALKNLARELEIPVLALSQINREIEKRENKRPVMSDLRESGDLEQESDVIIMAYRDEVYHATADNKGKAEFGIPKNRHGPLGNIECHFEAQYLRFEDFGDPQDLLDIPPIIEPPPGRRDAFSYRPE
jgi:replicative DNA helicase